MDSSGRYGTVLTLFRGYSHKIITEALAYGKNYVKLNPGGPVEFKFAGGLFGILAAVTGVVVVSSLARGRPHWGEILLVTVVMCALAVGLFTKGLGLPFKIWPG